MSTHETTETVALRKKQAATAAKLIKAAALAAALVPLGSVAMEADSITCGFGAYYNDVGSGGCTNTTGSSATFDFGDYVFELDFIFGLGDNQNFYVTVNTTTNLELSGTGEEEPFAGYECIALSATDGCVDFQVATSAQSGENWDRYSVKIDWENWNDHEYDVLTMRLLHDSSEFDGAEAAGTYDFDMCTNPDLYDACVAEVNPGIRSGDTDFDSFMAAESSTPVPEPSSLMLLATGVGGTWLGGRRRRRRD